MAWETDTAFVCHVRDMVERGGDVEGAVYIGRAVPRMRLKASPLANPHRIADPDDTAERREAVDRFERDLALDPELQAAARAVRGRPLACWCRRGAERASRATACHGDRILEWLWRHPDPVEIGPESP